MILHKRQTQASKETMARKKLQQERELTVSLHAELEAEGDGQAQQERTAIDVHGCGFDCRRRRSVI